MLCLVAQSCLTLCNPTDCSPPGSSVHGILQARMLEWVAMPSSRGSSQPRDRTQISCIVGRFFTIQTTKEVPKHAPEQNLKYTILVMPWHSLDSACVYVCAESECSGLCILTPSVCVCLCVCACACTHAVSRDKLFVTLWSVPTRLPCLWDFPSKNTEEGCHFFLQGIFPTQGWKSALQADSLPMSHWGSPLTLLKGMSIQT